MGVSTGWPSSMQDSRIFRNSYIGKHLDALIEGTVYPLIFDGGYMLEPEL